MTKMIARSLFATGFVLALVSAASAAKVKVWHHHAPAQYDKARLQQTVISNEGAIRLSRQLKPLANLDVAHVWDVVEDRNGNLFVATGDEGKIFKVTPEGKSSVVFDSEDSQVLCLALAPDGSIYAGTGPKGLIVRIAPNGTAKVLYDSPESYVWSLAISARGDKIFAGTGPKGRIYRVTPEGKAGIHYTTKQDHVLCLASGPDDTLYAGTDKGGLVYRIDAAGRGFVLFSAPQAEVRSLLVTPNGILAGTSVPVRRRVSAGNSSGTERTPPLLSSSKGTVVSTTREKSETAAEESSTTKSSVSSETSKGSPSPSVPAPSSGENSVYRIQADGTIRELFRDKVMMLSLLRHKDRILVGTGMEGQLFEINEATRERTEIVRLDHGQIHCLRQRRDGSVILGTGDPGRLYVLQDKFAAQGTVVSEVLDAKILSRWGALRWQAQTPPGTRIHIAVRSGNVADPDETWSDWSAEQTDAEQAAVLAPAARFLQYRATLATTDATLTPALRGLAIRYKTTNQAPEVQSIEVPDLDAAALDNPKKLKLKWTATDANEDELTFRLLIRKDGWDSWVELDHGLEKKEFEWDTTTTPSGIYRLKVVASDRKDNAADEALTGDRISAPFVVAHELPKVTLKVAGVADGKATIVGSAADPLVRLTSAAFAVNGKTWTNVFPSDGLFDSKTETFRFQTESLKPGTYVLVLRVSDAAGNTGAGDVVFTVPPRPGQ